MKTLILIAALLPGIAMAAEQPKKKAPQVNPCSQYGEGFVQLKGSKTCVKVGGSVQVDVGVNTGAPPR